MLSHTHSHALTHTHTHTHTQTHTLSAPSLDSLLPRPSEDRHISPSFSSIFDKGTKNHLLLLARLMMSINTPIMALLFLPAHLFRRTLVLNRVPCHHPSPPRFLPIAGCHAAIAVAPTPNSKAQYCSVDQKERESLFVWKEKYIGWHLRKYTTATGNYVKLIAFDSSAL